MKFILALVFGLLGTLGFAATREYTASFSQECLTVEGDSLDADGDGICEDLNGFRVYDEDGNFVHGIPEDGTRTITFSMNRPWGEQCLTMTSHMTDPIDGSFSESALSAPGGCLLVRPGKPTAPIIQ